MFFTVKGVVPQSLEPPSPYWKIPSPNPTPMQEEAGGAPAGSPVTVEEPLPSLNDMDSMLLLYQYGELSGHLKYVFTLQDDIPLWRGRGSSELQVSGVLNVEVPQRSAVCGRKL